MLDKISIRGARANNLKNVDLDLPRDKLIVFTGLSGSGKSSLAFDTIFAEGQRRYVESLSSYARQFLGQMDKPDVDSIDGLSPAISIDQKTTSKNPRSTVGTVTEIYDYLRLLWARVGTPIARAAVRRSAARPSTRSSIRSGCCRRERNFRSWLRSSGGKRASTARSWRMRGAAALSASGWTAAYTSIFPEEITLDKNKKHHIELVVDRLVMRGDIRRRLADSIETATARSGGLVIIQEPGSGAETLYSQNYACDDCGVSLQELTPRMFSFNNPYGACPACTGLGFLQKADPELVIPDPSRSIWDGGIEASGWNSVKSDSIARMYF